MVHCSKFRPVPCNPSGAVLHAQGEGAAGLQRGHESDAANTASWCHSSWGWTHCAWHLGEPAPRAAFLLPREQGWSKKPTILQKEREGPQPCTCGPLRVAHGGWQPLAFSELSRFSALPAGGKTRCLKSQHFTNSPCNLLVRDTAQPPVSSSLE